MKRPPTDSRQQPPQIQLLAEFLRELETTRRNLAFYPPHHPRINTSIAATQKSLLKFFATRPELTLCVAPKVLYLDSTPLPENPPVFGKFARFLSAIGVAALRLQSGVTAEELIRFCQLLFSGREGLMKFGDFAEALRSQKISHIELTPIDYEIFQISQHQTGKKDNLWEDFLHGVLRSTLDPAGDSDHDPELIADLINRQLKEFGGSEAAYQQAVSNLVSRLPVGQPAADSDNPDGGWLGRLLRNLEPSLQQSFLRSAFSAVKNKPDLADSLIHHIPHNLLQEYLQLNRQQADIPSRLVDLINHLDGVSPESATHSRRKAGQPFEKEVLRARLEILFQEENQDLFMPSSYQNALRSILDEEIYDPLLEEEKQRLNHSLESQCVETQCCHIIFELLQGDPDPSLAVALQENLLELSQFFLDIGDFDILGEIHDRWSQFLFDKQPNLSIFNEKVLSTQTQPYFINEVLDGISTWGKEKFDSISRYVVQVGEPYVEPLIHRLAVEPKMSHRRRWMTILERLGVVALPAMTRALQDKRWYLVRNLLIILDSLSESAPLKSIHPLTKHPHPKVRQEALRIFLRYHPSTGNRLLIKELHQKNPDALLAAIQVAELSRDDQVVALLHSMLTTELHGDSELAQKKQLLRTLARIGRNDSLTYITALLQRKGLLLSRRQKELQQAAIRALADFPRQLGEPLLRELVRNGSKLQTKIAEEALLHLGGGLS